jgi:hypothetical protein
MTNAIEKQKKILRLIFQPCQVNMCERIICLGIRKRMYMYTQDVHSGRRNGALNDRKRRFTALIFTLFHRNPSVRITTAVSCYGTTIVLHRFYIHFWTDGFGRFSPVYSRFRPFTRRSVGPGYIQMHDLNDNFFSIDVRKRNNGTFFLNWPRPLLNTEMNGIFEFRQ